MAEPDLLTVRAGLFPQVKRIVPKLFDSTVRREAVRSVHVVVRKFGETDVATASLDSITIKAHNRQNLTILTESNDSWQLFASRIKLYRTPNPRGLANIRTRKEGL
ncbi:MAG TPA: hypothetical protein VNA15_12440, partial [Candidatus Angelobacter sp.]|nr:hypothetical protein [Candidatus Angelobacter sp.]